MHSEANAPVDSCNSHPSTCSNPEPTLSPPPGRTSKARLLRLKHGLHSKYAVIPGESEEEFRLFRHDLMDSLRPIGPHECGMAEQLILAQWQLRRIAMIQTGVFELFDRATPREAGETEPMRLARCFRDDTARGQTLEKMSLHQQRLSNAFHRAARFLMLSEEQREKNFTRIQRRGRIKDDYYEVRGHGARPKNDDLQLENYADVESLERQGKEEHAAQAPKPAPERAVQAPAVASEPAEAQREAGPVTAPATTPDERATPSSDASSGESADRGAESAATLPSGLSLPQAERRLKELTAQYWALRREVLAVTPSAN